MKKKVKFILNDTQRWLLDSGRTFSGELPNHTNTSKVRSEIKQIKAGIDETVANFIKDYHKLMLLEDPEIRRTSYRKFVRLLFDSRLFVPDFDYIFEDEMKVLLKTHTKEIDSTNAKEWWGTQIQQAHEARQRKLETDAQAIKKDNLRKMILKSFFKLRDAGSKFHASRYQWLGRDIPDIQRFLKVKRLDATRSAIKEFLDQFERQDMLQNSNGRYWPTMRGSEIHSKIQ